ncbi:unnamed protein product [Lupinus luteus]|uniref:Pectinesterase inhibitor domain-containing protein n=1 Tax=Lupinus luteus TaxID=3873 RepID=A0AAV1Y8C6_LUPLU
MKTFNSLSLILSLQILLFMFSTPSSHAKTFLPNDETLISFTCSRTPYPNLCVGSLILYPGSDRVDMWGLAEIMLDHILKIKANKALEKIQQLQKAGTGPNQGLDSCASKYNEILTIDIPKASAAFQKKDRKGAQDGANAAADKATSCETGFPNQLTLENTNMHGVAANAAAIIGRLHDRQ